MGNQPRRRVALAATDIAVQGRVDTVYCIYQPWPFADDNADCFAGRAIDLIAFARLSLVDNAAEIATAAHDTASCGSVPYRDVKALHPRYIPL